MCDFKVSYQRGERLLFCLEQDSNIFLTFSESFNFSNPNLHFIPFDISEVHVDFAQKAQRDSVKRLTICLLFS